MGEGTFLRCGRQFCGLPPSGHLGKKVGRLLDQALAGAAMDAAVRAVERDPVPGADGVVAEVG